ncbi:MAG TPA: FHA domain-containing protein [Gammaproteobacteria bacterium]|nr:FHA domain-containing protein [Gammaproteobacteria bacterium]
MSRLYSFLVELSRRKVPRALGGYLVLLWLLAQGVAQLFPAFGLPDWTVRFVIILGILVIPVVVFLSWRFDLTPHGLVSTRRSGPIGAVRRTPLAPELVEWLEKRHNAVGAGHLTASWSGPDQSTQRKVFFAPFTIGRVIANDIQLPDKCVSRTHALVWAENERWFVRDLASSNGTWLDGERVTVSLLPPRCSLRLDREGPVVRLEIEMPQPTEISAAERAAGVSH